MLAMIFWFCTKSKGNKSKNKQWDYIRGKSSCSANNQQNEKATYRMGKNICKPHIQ